MTRMGMLINPSLSPYLILVFNSLMQLAARLSEKSKGSFVLGGDLLFANNPERIEAMAAAAVDPDDGETRPWASCIGLNMSEAGSVSTTATIAAAMFTAKGRVILQNGYPHVAVGLAVDYVQVGPLYGDAVSTYNEFCRIEELLIQQGRLAP